MPHAHLSKQFPTFITHRRVVRMTVVSIAKGRDPYNTTIEALKNLLDSGAYIPKITVIKPNLLATVDRVGCINTDSRVCEAIVDFLISLGNREIICAEGATNGRGDEPLTKTFTAFRNNGFYEMRKKISRYVDLNTDRIGKWMRVVSLGLDYEAELGIARTVLENCVASVAKFKTHDALGLTLTLKNMMGSLCQSRKADTGEIVATADQKTKYSPTKRFMHGWGEKLPKKQIWLGPSKNALAKNLVILASHVRPSLAIIDGIVAMEGDGPLSGKCKNLGVIIASTDPVACDVVACEVAGFSPIETGYIYATGKIGLGEYILEEIEVVGEKIENVKQPLKPHKDFPHTRFSKEAAERLIGEVKGLL